MAFSVDDIIQLTSKLAEEKEIKVAVKESAKGGIIAGGSAFVGGLLGGPIGIAAGAAAGGAVAAYVSYGNFKPVAIILLEMEPEKKQVLFHKCAEILANVGPVDFIALTAFVSKNMAVKEKLLGAVLEHVHKELKMEIID